MLRSFVCFFDFGARCLGGWISEVKCGAEDGSQVDLWLGFKRLGPQERSGLTNESAINGLKEVEKEACH